MHDPTKYLPGPALTDNAVNKSSASGAFAKSKAKNEGFAPGERSARPDPRTSAPRRVRPGASRQPGVGASRGQPPRRDGPSPAEGWPGAGGRPSQAGLRLPRRRGHAHCCSRAGPVLPGGAGPPQSRRASRCRWRRWACAPGPLGRGADPAGPSPGRPPPAPRRPLPPS